MEQNKTVCPIHKRAITGLHCKCCAEVCNCCTRMVDPNTITINPDVTIVSTTVYTSRTYRQCLGTAWHGSGQCSSCGVQMGSGGNCLAMIEIAPTTIEEEK